MLKTDYKDDVLNTDTNVNRRFSIVRSNGTVVEQNVELRETTTFKQTGDSFGAKDINETNKAVNDLAGKLQTEVDDVKGQIHTNLLNPTAPTQTINGVTFTNNGDGTYTVNGTFTGNYVALDFASANIKGKCKLVGCPKSGGNSSFVLYKLGSSASPQAIDNGNGVIIDTNESNAKFRIIIYAGYTANNLLFKPMLTTDLSATYDDFVPYTGDSGRLNEDVANLVKGISGGISPITNSDIDTILNS